MKLANDQWLSIELEGMSLYRHNFAKTSGIPEQIIDRRIEKLNIKVSSRHTQKLYVLNPQRK